MLVNSLRLLRRGQNQPSGVIVGVKKSKQCQLHLSGVSSGSDLYFFSFTNTYCGNRKAAKPLDP